MEKRGLRGVVMVRGLGRMVRGLRVVRGVGLVAAVALLAAACGAGVGDAGEGGESAGPVPGPGFDGTTLTLGILTPLSDAVAVIGVLLTAGHEVYFERLNEEAGGVAGRYPVRLVQEDITYANPSTTIQKYNKVKDDVVMFAQILGTDHVNGVLPLLAEDELVAAPATLDAEWVRSPELVPVGAPYQIQAIGGAEYYVNRLGNTDRRVCSLIMATGYGEAGQEGLEFAAREMGFQIAATARFRPGDQEFVAQITQLRNAACDAVLLVSLPNETGRIMGAAAQLGFRPQWLALSPSWLELLAHSPLQAYLAEQLWVINEGSEWGDTTVAGMRAMMAAMARYRPDQKPDYHFHFGYTQAAAVHQILEKAAELGDFSRAGIRRAMVEVGTIRLDGLMGDYRYGPAAEREPPRRVSVFRVNPERPYGLELLESGIRSTAAERYVFE